MNKLSWSLSIGFFSVLLVLVFVPWNNLDSLEKIPFQAIPILLSVLLIIGATGIFLISPFIDFGVRVLRLFWFQVFWKWDPEDPVQDFLYKISGELKGAEHTIYCPFFFDWNSDWYKFIQVLPTSIQDEAKKVRGQIEVEYEFLCAFWSAVLFIFIIQWFKFFNLSESHVAKMLSLIIFYPRTAFLIFLVLFAFTCFIFLRRNRYKVVCLLNAYYFHLERNGKLQVREKANLFYSNNPFGSR